MHSCSPCLVLLLILLLCRSVCNLRGAIQAKLSFTVWVHMVEWNYYISSASVDEVRPHFGLSSTIRSAEANLIFPEASLLGHSLVDTN